jgi:hypothetical protein
MKLRTNDIIDPIDETEFNEVHALFNELHLHYISNDTIYISTLMELGVYYIFSATMA